MEPLTPVAVTVKLPVPALEAAEKSTGALAPAATPKEPAGFETIPAGKPESETWTVPEKPFRAPTGTLTAELVAPCCTLTEF